MKHAIKKPGCVALVTGGAQGIGLGIAESLMRKGVTVAIVDINYPKITAKRLGLARGRLKWFKANVAVAREVTEVVQCVLNQFGRIDILVNNAGTSENKNILAITEEDWDRIMGINLKSAFLCSKAVMPIMIRQRYGRIISVSSISARRGALFGHVHYSASKAGMLGLTRTLAIWAAKYGITVNAVAPGSIATGLINKIHTKTEIRDIVSRTPVGRMGTPADVGELVAFLASDVAGNMTGCVVDTNGGQWIGS